MKIIFNKIIIKLTIYKNMISNCFFKPTVIFFYHRVAKVVCDPHKLSVSPENFENQLLYLRDNFKIIRLSELVQILKNKKIIHGLAVITFDDGYVDNFTNALPILEKLQIPATIFVTAGKVGSNEPFYWDEKTDKKDQGRALTENELRELAKNSLIEIGAHTMTHPHLATLPPEKQKYEIEGSKKMLENILGKPVTSFAYPFGGREEFTQDTIRILESAGFQIACTTIKGKIRNTSLLLTIPRRIIRNWDIPNFKKYIKNL